MTGTKLERQITRKLADDGLRPTAARTAVIRSLAAADGPRSAAELYEHLDGAVPLSSLYRSLAVLEEAGILDPHHGARGLTRYELAEWLSGHHHHLVCVVCGAVDDIRLPDRVEAALEGLVAEVTDSAAFAAAGHSLEIEGRCRRCA
jgi:Fur family transcriptional regulator, ferric uptake regulator